MKIKYILLFLVALPYQIFPLTWEDIASSAVKNNNALESARHSLYASQANARGSIASVLPNVSLSASGNKSGTDLPVVSNSENYSVSVRAGIIIFDGLKTPNNIIASFENANAAAYSFNEKSAAVRYKVFSDYINLLKAAELVKVTSGITERRKIQMEQVKLRYQGGRENLGSVKSAEADYERAVMEADSAIRGLDFAFNELKRSSGISAVSYSEIIGSLEIDDDKPPEADPKREAFVSNSYLAASCRRKATEALYRATLGVFSPDVSLNASAGRSGNSWPPDYSRSWTLGLSLSFDVFKGGENIAKIQAAGDSMEAAKADERQAYDDAVSLLESANNSLKDAFAAAKAMAKTLEAAETRAMIADSQYSNGLMDYDTWSVIQDSLMNARKNNIQAKAAYFTAKASLDKARGKVLDEK